MNLIPLEQLEYSYALAQQQREHNHTMGLGAGGELRCPCGSWWIILRRPNETGRVFICPDCQDWHSILFR